MKQNLILPFGKSICHNFKNHWIFWVCKWFLKNEKLPGNISYVIWYDFIDILKCIWNISISFDVVENYFGNFENERNVTNFRYVFVKGF